MGSLGHPWQHVGCSMASTSTLAPASVLTDTYNLLAYCRVFGLTGTPWAAYGMFIGCHITVSTCFYVHCALMSWPWAFVRVSRRNVFRGLLHCHGA
eukprot:scaffold48911_cov18-Tisochrysis_lutea.AAC.4